MTYVGAGSRLPPEIGLALDCRRWAWQPKIDGAMATVTTDRAGRICSVLSRAGREFSEASDLHGILAGPPHSVLVGEIEAHTEAGNRLAACRGWRNLHLFDATYIDGRSIAAQPYAARYGALHQAQALLEQDGLARIRTVVDKHGRHQHAVGRKYTSRAPRDIRRLPIVPMARGRAAARELWDSYTREGEGLVAVRLDAPAGLRGAKRKIKLHEDIEAVVTAICPSAASLLYAGQYLFHVSARGAVRPQVGEVWTVAADGFYEGSSKPRFPRLVRRRDDLTGTASAQP